MLSNEKLKELFIKNHNDLSLPKKQPLNKNDSVATIFGQESLTIKDNQLLLQFANSYSYVHDIVDMEKFQDNISKISWIALITSDNVNFKLIMGSTQDPWNFKSNKVILPNKKGRIIALPCSLS